MKYEIPENVHLNSQTSFLLYISSRNYIKILSEELAKLNITYLEYLILYAMRDNDAMTISAICASIHIEPGSVSPYIKELCNKKYIFKRHNKRDKRSFVVKLNDSGRELISDLEKVTDGVNEKLGFTKEYLNEVNGCISNVFKTLENAAE